MKKCIIHTLLLFSLIFSSCAPHPGKADPVVAPKVILKDFMTYLNYNTRELKFSEDFSTYSTAGAPISKAQFFSLYASGAYLPIRLKAEDGQLVYRLYGVSEFNTTTDMLRTIKQFGSYAENEYLQIGKPLTGFNFTDLHGKVYTTDMLKGKIVALKFWFIKCHACNEEIPALNKVVEGYKDRKDILFLSLATDAPTDLQAFLKKTKFNYAVISEQHNYLEKHFQTSSYPTHVLINKKGIVTLVTSDAKTLTEKLKKEAS